MARASGACQFESGDLRADVEAHANQMAEAAVDVETTTAGEREFARHVAAVAHRQQRRRQERRLALAAVRVAREDPALITVPARQIDRVGIVAQNKRRLLTIEPRQRRRRLETVGPEIVEAG